MLKFHNKKNTTATFLERVAMFDFDKYYTPKVRILCHMVMWTVFAFFIWLNLLLNDDLNITSSLLFTGRSILCGVVTFYLLFYYIIPYSLGKNKIVLIIFSIPFCIILWTILEHYYFVSFNDIVSINIKSIQYDVNANVNQEFLEVISLKNLLITTIIFFYSISPFLFIKILFDIIRYYSTVFKTERKSKQLEIEKLNLESDFLKAQLNPHFLFNTLNNLFGLALKKSEELPNIILQLSAIMRYTLYESNTESVLLSKELAFIKNYALLEKIRYNKDKKIILDIDETNISNQKIAPLLTFVFLENAFKYGLTSGEASFLEIKISVTGKMFYFSVVNDKDLSTINSRDKKLGGIGIENIKRRLELLYPGRYQLSIEDEASSFRVKLQMEIA